MDRYLDLELECGDGGAHKATLFGGMFKKSSKSAKSTAKAQSTVSLQNPELSASSDSLTDKSSKDKFGMLGGNMKQSPQPGRVLRSSQDHLEISPSKESVADTNAKDSGGMFSGLFKKSPKTKIKAASEVDLSEHSDSSESNKGPSSIKDDLSEPESAISDNHTAKSAKNAVVEAMSKLNPFSSATKKDTGTLEDRKELETKTNPVKSNMIQPERRKRSDALLIPAEEEMKTSAQTRVQQQKTEEKEDKSPGEMKVKPSEAPAVPARPSEEELSRIMRHQQKNDNQETKVIKHKHPNPLMPQVASQAASDDEGLKKDEEFSPREEKKEEEGKEKTEKVKVKKPKRLNPFMPQVKAKVIQKQAQDGAAGHTTENEAPSRSLCDQLEDFYIDPSQPKDNQDVEDLMDWWNTVEPWEDSHPVNDMTEKEEAKAFAVTAERVQKGIRVFNKLFSERAESLWQHVIDLNAIADSLDKFNKNTKIAQITGGSTSAIGGVATIAGLALAPVTMGTSLIITAVGLSVATAGGLTSAGAGISNQVNNSLDRKKVEKIVEDYQDKIADLNKCLKFIKQGIENLRKFDLIKMKKHTYNQDFPALTSQFYEDGAMAGKAILINANEIMRVVQIANVAGSTAARAVQIASMATGVLTGLFVGMDIYFVAKDSKELKKGAKSEFAAKIREVAVQLHSGLVELNSIREELQSNRPESKNETKDPDSVEKDKSDNFDSSDDEIDRIKKAIKKDTESRE